MKTLIKTVMFITLIAPSLKASSDNDIVKWDEFKLSPMSEQPSSFENTLSLVDPVIVELPASTFEIRKDLIESLINHYNGYTKPKAELLNNEVHLFNPIQFINDDLRMFVQDVENDMRNDIINNMRDNFILTLSRAIFIIEPNGKYRFIND